MNNSIENTGPRIGIYYGVVIDQDCLAGKVQPIEIASLVEKIAGLTPFDSVASWKLDYDHSQCCRTMVVYHKDYTKITNCTGFVGGWGTCGNTKIVPDSISQEAENISTAVEKLLYPFVDDHGSYAVLAVGYCILYFVA